MPSRVESPWKGLCHYVRFDTNDRKYISPMGWIYIYIYTMKTIIERTREICFPTARETSGFPFKLSRLRGNDGSRICTAYRGMLSRFVSLAFNFLLCLSLNCLTYSSHLFTSQFDNTNYPVSITMESTNREFTSLQFVPLRLCILDLDLII